MPIPHYACKLMWHHDIEKTIIQAMLVLDDERMNDMIPISISRELQTLLEDHVLILFNGAWHRLHL